MNQRVLIRAIPEHDGIIPTGAFEKDVIGAVERFVKFQRDVGITPPIVLMVSLIGTRGVAIAVDSARWSDSTIDRDVLNAPDVLIEDFNSQADVLLRPVFDFIWQAAGLADCPNYGENGRWKEPR